MSCKYEINKQELEEMYVNQGMSTIQIANVYGCNPGTVYAKLKKYKLPIKSKSEGKYKSKETISANGYVIVTPPGHKQVYKHRYVMEQIMGRELESWEHVHHIDGDKTNNEPDNLQLFLEQCEHNEEHRVYPTEYMLAWVEKFYLKNGRRPRYNEFTEFHYDTMRERFGCASEMNKAISSCINRIVKSKKLGYDEAMELIMKEFYI